MPKKISNGNGGARPGAGRKKRMDITRQKCIVISLVLWNKLQLIPNINADTIAFWEAKVAECEPKNAAI
jgi:hypothetical protein